MTARIIRHKEKLPTFDKVRSMILLEENGMANTTPSFFNHSPTVLMTTTSGSNQPNTLGNLGFELCRNTQCGTCAYGQRCKFIYDLHDHRPIPPFQPSGSIKPSNSQTNTNRGTQSTNRISNQAPS